MLLVYIGWHYWWAGNDYRTNAKNIQSGNVMTYNIMRYTITSNITILCVAVLLEIITLLIPETINQVMQSDLAHQYLSTATCLIRPHLFTLLDVCVSSLRRSHVHLLCIVPSLTDDPRMESEYGLICCFCLSCQKSSSFAACLTTVEETCVRQVVLNK